MFNGDISSSSCSFSQIILSFCLLFRNCSGNFLLRLTAKDPGCAIQEGKKVPVELATAAAAPDTFQKRIAAGHGKKDVAAIIEPFGKS